MSKNLILDRFAEPVTALADTPALAAAELKRRFQAPAEELRQVHNALAEQHAALEDKVEGIVTEIYGGTIHESMLDTPLAAKINAKAEQSALEAEAAARETLAQTVATKCEAFAGTYTGDGTTDRVIELGFRPVAVIILCDDTFFAFKTQGYTCSLHEKAYLSTGATTETGFVVSTSEKDGNYTGYNTNKSSKIYEYLAFKA